MEINLTNKQPKPLIEITQKQLIDKLNSILDVSSFFYGLPDKERIFFHGCANVSCHSKLIGILLLYFASLTNHSRSYIAINLSDYTANAAFSNEKVNYIDLKKESYNDFYNFLDQLPSLDEINITV